MSGLPITWANLILYLLAINLLTFLAFWSDKRKAQLGLRRVSEQTLLLLGLAGGTPTAYVAMQILRHKTHKTSFRVRYWLTVISQIGAVIYLADNNRLNFPL
jgi:uncharacterized membrane protein YsdA (DUF1294 family)